MAVTVVVETATVAAVAVVAEVEVAEVAPLNLQQNVEVKENSQAFITSGKEAKFDFTQNATCVVYVTFDAKKTVGKTTAIAEMLKGKSSLGFRPSFRRGI